MKNTLMWMFTVIAMISLVATLVVVFRYSGVALNKATLQHEVIQPKEGISCIVVYSKDGTSVDCWKGV